MEVIRNNGDVPFKNTVIALGNFDGLHKAHMAIMNKCREYASEHNMKSGVLLFAEHTLKIVANENVKIITPEHQKLKLLDEAGLDFAYIRAFDKSFMKLSPEEFIKGLVDRLNVKAVCAGYDYHFGYNAMGNKETLKALGKKYGFETIIVNEIDFDGRAVKSTLIRQLITEGNVSGAAEYLGRPFSIEGTVEKGLRNGTKMGIPTANIGYDEDMILPGNGVYAGYTYVSDKKYKSVINVGNNPTFGADKVTIESHILDFNDDIYGKEIRVEFIEYMRGDIKFNNIDELKKQINADIERARKDLI